MNTSPQMHRLHTFGGYFILLLVPLLIWVAVGFAYSKGVTGDLFYDDLSFLGPLEQIESFEDAKLFVTEGSGGPLGRPIALLSFLPHAAEWPDSSIDARRVNVAIHLFNGMLLFAIGFMVLRLQGRVSLHQAYWISLGAAGLWLALPILASTSLITVQRWTSLAMLFGLLGLAIFIYGYFLQAQRPRLALLVQALGLGLGTLLALFTKESGALFPIYALVIDAVLLRHLHAPRYVRWLRGAVLWLGLLALLYYLSPLYRDWFAFSDFRGWSSFERLLTQGGILWHYLHIAFLPKPGAFSPFYDYLEITRGWLIPTLTWGGFALLTTLAFVLRKKSPWPLFALLWFFTGHLIESTVIWLELAFEHRNYLAVYGFCLALAALAWQLPGKLARIGPVLFGIYGLMLWAILYATTSIWGNSLDAAENWVKHNPESPRAIMHLSTTYHNELGNPSYSLYVLDRAIESCTKCTDVRMQALLYRCGQDDQEEIAHRFENILLSAKDGRASIALLDSFYPWQELLAKDACPPLTNQDIYQLTQILLANPNFRNWRYQVHILFHAAYFAKEQDDIETALAHLAHAESLRPQVMPILQMQVHLFLQQNRYDEALDAIERRRLVEGRDRFMSDEALDELATAVHEAMS